MYKDLEKEINREIRLKHIIFIRKYLYFYYLINYFYYLITLLNSLNNFLSITIITLPFTKFYHSHWKARHRSGYLIKFKR